MWGVNSIEIIDEFAMMLDDECVRHDGKAASRLAP
jgi:hypothetical protein